MEGKPEGAPLGVPLGVGNPTGTIEGVPVMDDTEPSSGGPPWTGRATDEPTRLRMKAAV